MLHTTATMVAEMWWNRKQQKTNPISISNHVFGHWYVYDTCILHNNVTQTHCLYIVSNAIKLKTLQCIG